VAGICSLVATSPGDAAQLIAVAETQVSPAPPIRPIHALSDTQVREIEDSIYFHNHIQGRRLQVMSLVTAAAAERLLSKSIQAYASRGEG
jgi:hypothetical protein